MRMTMRSRLLRCIVSIEYQKNGPESNNPAMALSSPV
jgi:hypothetical protein